MIECFVCSFKFANPQKLCDHLKIIHQLSGQNMYKCTLCGQQLTQMWRFRRHLDTCYINLDSNSEAPGDTDDEQNDLLNFESKIHKLALEFVCNLAGNMCIPRNFVFEMLRNFKSFYSSMITEGFSQYIMPNQSEEKKVNVEYLLNIFDNPFKRVDSEYKLNDVLHKADLISSPTHVKFVKIDGKWYDVAEAPDCMLDEDTSDTEESLEDVEDADSSETDDTEADDTEADDTESDNTESDDTEADESKKAGDCKNARESTKIWNSRVKHATEKESVLLMPLEFQFRKFFELPNVFKKTQDYAKKLSEQSLGHFINGEAWKKKLESFKKEDIVIPFHLHTDDVQINNALGAHRKAGLETCTYYSFPTVPPEFNSRYDNIFVAQLFSSDANKKLGNFCCFKNMIESLNKFGQDGIILKIDGKEQRVHFVLGLTLGDNKGVNDMCGFARGHRANYFCRFCKMHIKKTETATVQDDKLMRNEKNYAEDVAKNRFSETGVTEESIINFFFLCFVTNSIGADVMHDILEGILHYNMCEIILYFIRKGYFSLDQLNQLKFDLSYGEIESNNKSPPIVKKRLEAKKLLMSASEMNTFARHFVFMVGHLVPKSDPAWQFYLTTMKFVELIDLTNYTEEDITDLKKTISKMNRTYVTLFHTHLKPKHHLILHYPTLIRRYGSLRPISSMRFEAKHRFVKNYTKNTISRRNVSVSLSQKLQYSFAAYLLKNTGLTDSVSIESSKFIQLQHSEIYGRLERTEKLTEIGKKNLKETKKVKINGVTFSTKLSIPVKRNSDMALMKIIKIVYVTEKLSDIFLICEEYGDVLFNSSYGCYEVDFSHSGTHLKLISIISMLEERQHPISTHVMGDTVNRFKTKSF